MKQAMTFSKGALFCGFGCLVGAALWGFGWQRARAGGEAAKRQAAILATLPQSTGKTMADKQIAKWQEQAQSRPQDQDAWTNLGEALMQKARETADYSYCTHAEKAFQKALELNPKSVAAITGMAWVNGTRHEFEKSIEWANKALALDPGKQEAYGLLGDATLEMGDYEGAYKHYQKMLDLRPDLSSYSRGAHLLQQTGATRKAVLLMVKAIQAGAPYAENTAWCRAQLALILFNDGHIVGAEQTLQATLKTAPDNYQALAAMGRIQAAKKNYRAAIDYYTKAVAIAPQLDSLVALGDLYTLIGKPQEAEKQYALVEAVHQLNKANGVRGDMLLALFYADHDRNLPEALREAEAEYVTRKNVYAADTLAWCYYKNGRITDAWNTIQQAMSQHTHEARFYYHAGLILAKLGRTIVAQNTLSHALSLNPNFSPMDAPRAVEAFQQLGSHGARAGTVATTTRGEER